MTSLRVLPLIALLMAVPLDPVAAQEETPQAFFEDFDTLSPNVWRVSDGWSNGRWQNCTWSNQNVTIENGIVTLWVTQASDTSTHDYRCGEIQTHRRFGHGTFEVRMRTGRGSGLNAAFFTYIGPVHNAPHDEIDVEILTKDTSRVSFNTYVSGEPHGGGTTLVPGGTETDFVHYAFEWSPDRIRWFVNGTSVHETRGPLPSNLQKIWLSYWSTATLTAWMGRFDTGALPARLEVDWVGYTPLDDRCLFPASITCAAR
ncbi:hypothetical protein OCH239_15250 [Roseivivax halodurans JCM 10272]|uniref:GH16 domain-containing protein n=1 Tax=Roseivivax halodurans JCM 10272 TaxID=1449350 RepID=X7EA47_9RHOB|nr:family 16 glycosylhydrolase [Roseivivax halodurans]ETX12934.1 hypothetical protein OCH239_15250 [Roseivivax halodurans JCM 10272]